MSVFLFSSASFLSAANAKISLFHWLYTQNGLNLFSLGQHSKKMLTKRERHSFFFFASIYLKNSKKIHPTFIFGCKKGCKSRNYLIYTLFCGERGIRTPGTSQYNGFQDRRDRPLCHLSKTPISRSASLRKRCKGTESF